MAIWLSLCIRAGRFPDNFETKTNCSKNFEIKTWSGSHVPNTEDDIDDSYLVVTQFSM